MRIVFLFLILLCSIAGNAEEPGAALETCDDFAKQCLGAYSQIVKDYQGIGCQVGAVKCQEPTAELKETCGRLKAIGFDSELKLVTAESFAKREPLCTQMANYCTPEQLQKNQGSLAAIEAAQRAGDCKTSSGKNGPSEPVPAGAEVNLKGGVINRVVPKEEQRFYFDLSRIAILSGKSECIEKQNKHREGKKAAVNEADIDDPTLFCRRFFPEKGAPDGGKGNLPLELSNKIAEAKKAGVRFSSPVRIVLDFKKKEDCLNELKRLEFLHGGVVELFAPFSSELPLICDAIENHSIPSLWLFKPSPAPYTLTGSLRN